MKATELRLGNTIAIYPEQISVEVQGIKTDQLIVYSPNSEFTYNPTIDDCYGIPLSNDLLKQHGFTANPGEYYVNYWLPNKIGLSMAINDISFGFNDKAGLFYIGETHKEIKYLHELQNYLYAVYGYELK